MKRGSAISRRLLVALFAVTLVPMLGWSVLVDLSERLAGTDEAAREAVVHARRQLVLVLSLSLATFTGSLFFLRRVLVRPLEQLAAQARKASSGWSTPSQCDRDDEIGDLARGLDDSIGELHRRAERALRFASDLSHELRTPLAAIRGAAEILVDADLNPADRARFHENVLRESQRLERMVAGILELERGNAGELPPEPPSELSASLLRVEQALAPLLARRELRVRHERPEGELWTGIGADRHERVLYCLVENAIKFAPSGSVIELRVERRGDALMVSVSDEGPGVPAHQAVEVFERRRSADAANARGTGLGLAIAKALVDRWQGGIEVRPSSLGGACFTYRVPAVMRAETQCSNGTTSQRSS